MRANYNRGFTIIELVVAMAFLGIVVVAVSELYTTLRQANRAANNYTVATQVAQQLIEQYRNTTYNNIALGVNDVTTASLSPYPNLTAPRSATTTVTQVDVNGLKQVDIDVTYTERTGAKHVELTTLISYKGVNR